MSKRTTRYLLVLAVLLVVARWFVPAEKPAERVDTAWSVLMNADDERDWLSERTTRTALPTEFSSRIIPSSVRTSVWRGRTHTSWNNQPTIAHQSRTVDGLSMHSLCLADVFHFTSRAVDYYIYALRHIII